MDRFCGKKTTSDNEKEDAAMDCENFTKLFPIYFPELNITRKMHTLRFVMPKLIREDKSDNFCYKLLKIEQAGEKLHHIWNILIQSRFFAIRNGCNQLLSAMLQYENNLYLKNKL